MTEIREEGGVHPWESWGQQKPALSHGNGHSLVGSTGVRGLALDPAVWFKSWLDQLGHTSTCLNHAGPQLPHL